MRLLAFDTTGDRLSLALDDGKKVRRRLERVGRDQDEMFPGAADRLLKSAGLELSDIDAFVAASGPGRFTGIRVGLTYATVLAKTLGKKAAGVSWLEACAWKAPASARLVVAVVPGWKGESFFQVFRRGEDGPRPIQPPGWAAPERLAQAVRESAGGEEALVLEDKTLSAVDLLAPARARLASGRLEELAPLYIKPPHYEKPAVPRP